MFHFGDTSTPAEAMEKGFMSPRSINLGKPPRIRSIYRRTLRFLLPSFLLSQPSSSSSSPRDEKPSTTAFLDGMRGYAAFAVYFCHFIMPTHPKAHIGWHGNHGVDDHWIPQLPILRLVYSGRICVFLFFVISGFSIALKPLALARRGAHSALFDALVSATFRRAPRLYLPCLATVALTLLMACCGAFDFASTLRHAWPFPSSPRRIPAVADRSVAQLASDVATQVWRWADPLNAAEQRMPYAIQLWTIPIELRCSLLSFVMLLGLAKVRPVVRMATLTFVAVYAHYRNHPEPALFLAGAVLAELHLIHQEHLSVSSVSEPHESPAHKLKATALFTLSLLLASYPARGAQHAPFSAPLYRFATLLCIPSTGDAKLHFWTSAAAILLVGTVSRSRFLQALFTTRVATYLGNTSFALYCVHQALINWFGYRGILFLWQFTGRESTVGYEAGVAITWVVQTVATVWAADVFWRGVDKPCVKFTRWIEKVCFVGG
jgi:peptidoglycan/LPS O-acetylase OafA/YrhL